jgi:hypothetical protein
MPKINLINPLFQSPYTYLQAAGSEGTDGSARGIHLRWDFLRQLGSEHLPKGNLSGSNGTYPSTSGFNKNNDFVRIYRVPYNKEYNVVVDFQNIPDVINESGNERIWEYNGFIPVQFDPTNTTDVRLNFVDTDQYDLIRANIDPAVDPIAFLKQYTRVVEVQTVGKLMFKGVFDIDADQPENTTFSAFNVQTIALRHDNFDATSDLEKYSTTCIKQIARLDPVSRRTFICENIAFFRFSSFNFFIKKLTLSTYVDHIIGENGPVNGNGNFTLIDQFSLDDGDSDNNTLVFKRLEDLSKYVIDKRWPKYNDTNQSTGEFTVKVQNYKDRWLDPVGLKEAVKTYLDLSATDTQAIGYLESDDPENDALSEVSYLDMLKLVSLDFHASRMLGLGHIDLSRGTAPGIKDGGLTAAALIDFINNTNNSSVQVRDYLVEKAPNSEPVLLAAVNRSAPLNADHLKDILNATPNLDDSVLLAALKRTPSLPVGTIQDLLVANSPLSDSVLKAMIDRNPSIPHGNIQTIVSQSYPLSDEVLLSIINKSVALPFGTVQNIMLANSPLSDEVLLALLKRNTPLPAGTIQNIFLENTPLSPLVEDALKSRTPALPGNVVNAILNSNAVAGLFNRIQHIYVMEYVTEVAIENHVPTQTTTHVYMSLPTSLKDSRLPAAPVLKPTSYGLLIENATGVPTQLTDDEGYSPYFDERVINLKRERFLNELTVIDLTLQRQGFCICEETPAIGFGIEYKLDSENSFRKPEINHDSEFNDHTGLAETIFVPNNGQELVFNHQEKEEGIHDYALYSINWFSRVSPLSNVRQTDFTKFRKRNTILPPFNFAVQLIQEESPLVFTTQIEQNKLADLMSVDKTLVRATFDWNYNHNKAYQQADYAEIFFKENPPKATKGKIVSVTQLPDRKVEVTTGFYTITSLSPSQDVTPVIMPADVSRFEGSTFVAGEKTFIIESVSAPVNGENPTFILRQIRETAVTDINNNNIFTVTEQFISPEVGDIFLTVENLAEPSNWDSKLTEKVYLEHFFKVVHLEIQYSDNPQNDGKYTIDNVTVQGGNTEIKVIEEIADDTVSVPGEITYAKRVNVIAHSASSGSFTVEGDISSEINIGELVLITASNSIDNSYTITNASVVGSDTVIEVQEPFQDVNRPFYLTFNKTVTIDSLNTADSKIIISGDLSSELIPPYRETVLMPNNSEEKVIVGGIFEKATIIEFLDKDELGNDIPNSRTGVYEITFDSYQLADHINSLVDWYKGIIRIMEDSNFLPTSIDPDRTTPEMKLLQVWSIDTSGSTLKLIAYDSSLNVDSNFQPIEDYVPILSGNSIDVNFHPSYRIYLTTDTNGTNNFEESSILPSIGEGSKQSFMGIRAIDLKELPNISSHITSPVILMAQEIVVPIPPGEPSGPEYATRPDFYGKSTYTFDVEVDTTDGRQPHMLVFYRANERKILDQLYAPATVADILNQLENLPEDDAAFFADRWKDLVNVNLDGNGLFKSYVPDGFAFPIPDNTQYSIPEANLNLPLVFPFDGDVAPGQMIEIVKQAIDGAFLPLTEQPVIYKYLNEGKQTSGRKPNIRDLDGQVLLPEDPDFDPSPMAVKYLDGSDTFVRFTDYTLDGAAKNFYFYYGIELTNQLKISGRSPIAGPVKLINTSPAEEPVIKKVNSQLFNASLEIPTAVKFEVNDYIKSEGIRVFDIYRTTNSSDSLSIRSMQLAKSVLVDEELVDDFSDVAFPLYGEPLFYRIVARREIFNEQSEAELIPSKPSNVVLTNVVDNVNPVAPEIVSENGTTTAELLENVVLKWNPTCYNGTYRLQKMNSSGNWVNIHEVKTNDELIQYPPIDPQTGTPDFLNYPETQSLNRLDDNDISIYHRFRVEVENSSGLFNLTDKPLTLATGCFDLQHVKEYVSYTDNHGVTFSNIQSILVDDGTNNNPGQMTFAANIPSILPAGHNSFVQLDITVTDDAGNTMTKSITSNNGTVTFNDGEGGLLLNDPNHSYTISTKLLTDLCSTGFRRIATLSYVHGPCNDLSNLNEIIQISDSSHTFVPDLQEMTINDGVATPGSLTITDITNVSGLPNPQTFDQLSVTITDGAGNSSTKIINSEGGSVTFNDGDGDLILANSELNRSYSLQLQLTTSECTTGQGYNYNLFYPFTPCDAVQVLTSVASFSDNNGSSINSLENQDVNNGVNNPGGSITITETISNNLPAGHSFGTMLVTVYDGIGGTHTLPVLAGGNVTFNTGDGETGSQLNLGATNPNPTISIVIDLTTDLCSGSSFNYDLSYTYDPYEDLSSQNDVVQYTDGNGLVKNPLSTGPFNDGVNNNPGGSMTLTELISSNLPAGDTFDSVEITVQDGLGGSFTGTINSANGSLTVNHGQGGLVLNSSQPNRTYTFIVKVVSALCPDGVTFVYTGRYTVGV